MNKNTHTSWSPVAKWYGALVGEKGQYYHEHIVLPSVLRLLRLKQDSRLLDIACGQGVLGRRVSCDYVGIDLSRELIAEAKQRDRKANHRYAIADVSKPYIEKEELFTHASLVLALQNIQDSDGVIRQAAAHLIKTGVFVIVLNHPAFRIPRQSAWGIDEATKTQYRRINVYMSHQRIPITAHPGQKNSPVTWSFHFPISYYVQLLAKSGFVVDALEEWSSDKKSVGTAAKMENRAREEFPLFLTIRAVKN